MRGVQRGDGVLVWKGLPYAAPPTGSRRYAPPQPVASWTGVRDASAYGHAAPQVPLLPGLPETPNQSEDCLYLNVWSPSPRGRRPVIVWIHGGGFLAGTGNDPTFDGGNYAQRDCVVVTFNYRLGAFGSLYQPDRYGSGNLRLLDQMAALRWVRDNIAAFGGDPCAVTVMGESAGAMSIGALLGTPKARGLFHRAIIQNGGPRPCHTRHLGPGRLHRGRAGRPPDGTGPVRENGGLLRRVRPARNARDPGTAGLAGLHPSRPGVPVVRRGAASGARPPRRRAARGVGRGRSLRRLLMSDAAVGGAGRWGSAGPTPGPGAGAPRGGGGVADHETRAPAA
ncbi:carboxylesterase family protein, partial [Streptomyces sp. NPDC054940]